MDQTRIVLASRDEVVAMKRLCSLPQPELLNKCVEVAACLVTDRLGKSGYAMAYRVDSSTVIVGVDSSDVTDAVLDTVCECAETPHSAKLAASSQAGLATFHGQRSF